MNESDWTLFTAIAVFALSAAVIGIGGVWMTRQAERLARDTGLGQAVMGAVFVGATTSLSGTVMSIVAAANGHPGLAIGNTLGGIAAQTVFLVVADRLYRHANLEHAAASQANLLQGALLMVLLAVALLAVTGPEATLGPVHPASLLLVALYVYGVRLIAGSRHAPMWLPRTTRQTRFEPAPRRAERRPPLARAWLAFGALAAVVFAAGWLLAHAAVAVSAHAAIGEDTVGTLFTAITTSLPELIVAIAAVRRGALTLAVGNIIGGNIYDVLMLPVADIAYHGGSLYHRAAPVHVFWLGLNLLLTALVLVGLLRRERHGIGNIGTESVLVLVGYVAGVAALAWF